MRDPATAFLLGADGKVVERGHIIRAPLNCSTARIALPTTADTSPLLTWPRPPKVVDNPQRQQRVVHSKHSTQCQQRVMLHEVRRQVVVDAMIVGIIMLIPGISSYALALATSSPAMPRTRREPTVGDANSFSPFFSCELFYSPVITTTSMFDTRAYRYPVKLPDNSWGGTTLARHHVTGP